MLDNSTLQAVLGSRPFQFYPQVDSTMDAAQAWLRDGAPHGAVVIADEQMKGRGRLGRVWHTPPGVALAFSMILHPDRDHLHQVTMLGALAVADLIEGLGAQEVGIKWANDVLLNGKKVSGVLSEAVWQGDDLLGVILGIGVNVRNEFSDTDLESKATSIEHALDISTHRAALLGTLVQRIDAWTAKIGSDELFTTWQAKLKTVGVRVAVMHDSQIVLGMAEKVDTHGALFVRDDGGMTHRIIAGDLEIH